MLITKRTRESSSESWKHGILESWISKGLSKGGGGKGGKVKGEGQKAMAGSLSHPPLHSTSPNPFVTSYCFMF